MLARGTEQFLLYAYCFMRETKQEKKMEQEGRIVGCWKESSSVRMSPVSKSEDNLLFCDVVLAHARVCSFCA